MTNSRSGWCTVSTGQGAVRTTRSLGILFFLVLAAVFVLGLLLIPLGAWVEPPPRRRKGTLGRGSAISLGLL